MRASLVASFFLLTVGIVASLPEGERTFTALSLCSLKCFPHFRQAGSSLSRTKRDVVCAIRGTRLCNVWCKGKGFKEGECVWDTETGAFDCHCDQELRGIRCNLGGPNTCHYSCVLMGHREGNCDGEYRCVCGGGNNRLGEVIQLIRDRV